MRLYLIWVREEEERILLSQPENLHIKDAAAEVILVQGEMEEGGHWGRCVKMFCINPGCPRKGWKHQVSWRLTWLGSIWAGLPPEIKLCAVPHSKKCHSGILKYDWHHFECGNSQHVQPHVVALEEVAWLVCAQLHSLWPNHHPLRRPLSASGRPDLGSEGLWEKFPLFNFSKYLHTFAQNSAWDLGTRFGLGPSLSLPFAIPSCALKPLFFF